MENIFSLSKVCMDTYKSEFDKATQRKKQRFESLNKNYVPGSPIFIQERDKIAPEYEKAVESARDKAMKAFEESLEQTIVSERARATVITAETTRLMGVLDCLKDSPVSADEYQALVAVHGGKSYWTDRFFERIAEKNGIFETGVQPSLTAKLEVLNELAANTRDCLNNYNGEDKSFLVTSSEGYIFKLEEKYTNGYRNVHMSDRETAKRLVANALNKGDSMERSCAIANMLRTSKPDMQYEILSLLAEGEHPALSDPTMNFTGANEVINKFRKENLRDIKAAETAMEKIKGTKSRKEYAGTIYDNYDNRHFRKRMEEMIATTKDSELKDCYENVGEIKQEESQKAESGRK